MEILSSVYESSCMQGLKEELAGVQQQLVEAFQDLERERASFQQTSQATANQVSAHLASAQILQEFSRHYAKLSSVQQNCDGALF